MLKTIFWRGSVTSRAYYLGGNIMIGFVNFKRKVKATTITTLSDNRLVKINPREPSFFDAVLNFKSENEDIETHIFSFIEDADKVKRASTEAFYRVIYDPSETGDHMTIDFQQGKNPATGHSYNWWVEIASKMPPVEGRQWHIATEYQYNAFLVWLINQLVKMGESVEEALYKVVMDSKELGHYYDSKNSSKGEYFETTGSRCVCGIYDLANTRKILQHQNSDYGNFVTAGGDYSCYGDGNPIAWIQHDYSEDAIKYGSVGLLVL